ncbi:MAG: NADH-quinone oxidoreductase subunit M [Desulfovibrio sp.]|jgi:NADH-quinone oxidoreductase subunit M|nr:NADH-quinone oxidoreductase subunit M [Desulfovibrio sp.]
MADGTFPILSALILLPLLGAGLTLLQRSDRAVRLAALATGLAEAALSAALWLGFDATGDGYQFVERLPWLPYWNIEYALGIDGISLLMIVLMAALTPLCVLISWRSAAVRLKEFHACLLFMCAVCIGVFCALDLVLFYVFWEAMLVPMFLLIAIWGGAERKYAALKFFLYTLAGSALLLAAIVAFRQYAGTFSIPELAARDYPMGFQMLAFWAMALAFAVKMPMVPFHTWLPAAHVEAPTAGSVLLAAVLLKMGAYGFIRFCLGLTPEASVEFAPWMVAASLVSIVYGGFVALGQKDIKKLIAYSSIGHMGFVTLGIFLMSRQGMEGAILQMLNHGITAGALFMCVGLVYERSHSRQIEDNLGLGKRLPVYMFFLGLFSLSSLGFPGTNSFVGEALVLVGSFKYSVWVGLAAIPGALLGAAYMLRLLQRMAWGSPSAASQWADLNRREVFCLALPAILVAVLGFAPGPVLKVMDRAVAQSLERSIAASQCETSKPAIGADLVQAKEAADVR